MQLRLPASPYSSAVNTGIPALFAALVLLLLPFGSSAQEARFSHNVVIEAARALAETRFQPLEAVPDELLSLNYDQYRSIRYRKGAAIWGGTPTRFSIEFFAPGSLYDTGVDISIVENARALPIPLDEDAFEGVSDEIGEILASIAKVAGFRLHYSFNEDYQDEFIVFQGASYFRAVSEGQSYGLSARGLAIDVAEPTGEEFPIFREFWIERPSSRADSIVVHALLDSPRVTGAYRFGIYPGAPTRMDVEATLFARSELRHIGIGTLTSMYTFGSMDTSDRPDYRSAVHDSDGLAILNGKGEYIWRPLNNPRALQISAFMDYNPQGFGLMQRQRSLEDYQDLEANYHSRPSAWIRPVGNWGEGHVTLVEIPTPSEFNDNIVAYWQPATPLVPGEPFRFAYHMSWPDERPLPEGFGRVTRSAYGLKLAQPHPQMVIDYSDLPAGINLNDVNFDVTVSAGTVLETIAQPNHLDGARFIVTFDPRGAELIEIRGKPVLQGQPIGETWLYRWTGN
ncbi:glucan biosynthesis protein G [Pseudohongiella sp.]|uniref:Glucan biosynthesis periplasmic MdoG C-terminal domain-containing protein n=1 Tax=marine sediment metagenome TaxID=412755 RepID=A0A0F9W8L0_9ZZZZ|nr:glucan biosynthesis protein G [Pseudohongiella sp.]HDZ08175.1 glucan biosynthesis protein G [Pseudohongiella sp.]HEA63143.1 glucan biosynthesis protein G [Pseudohongiella sp.]